MYSNAASSISNNKYKIKFNNGTTKVVYSNSLWIEDTNSSIPLSESITTTVEVTEEDCLYKIDKANINTNLDENEDIIFPINGTRFEDNGSNNLVDDANEEDNGINDEVEINIGNLNIPADIHNAMNNNGNNNSILLSYH